MHTYKSLYLCSVAKYLCKLCIRLKSTRGPSAPLGARILTNPEDVFQHNMWDHVQWTEEEKERAREKAEDNSSVHVPLAEQGKYDTEACRYWNTFYETHHSKFFKDRRWLFQEFPELLPLGLRSTSADGSPSERLDVFSENSSSGRTIETCQDRCPDSSPQHGDADAPERPTSAGAVKSEETLPTLFTGQHANFRILEVGCGVGNSVFPIVKSIKETGAFVYCCDFSPYAIQLVKDHPDYDQSVCHAFVHDLCEEGSSFPVSPQSLDVVMAVFVLSSIHPARLQAVVNRLTTYLKPGGIFLFRDYGRYDFSQLRFKKGQCLAENFYTRGDGTCVYFFTKDEVHSLFTNAGLKELQNLEDRRLQVNRGKRVVMHRIWMQSKYQKTPSTG